MRKSLLLFAILLPLLVSLVAGAGMKEINPRFNNATYWTNNGCTFPDERSVDCENPTSGQHNYVESKSLRDVFGINVSQPYEFNYSLELTDDFVYLQMLPNGSSFRCDDCTTEDDVFGWYCYNAGTNARTCDFGIYLPAQNGTRPRTVAQTYAYQERFHHIRNDTGYYVYRNNKGTLLNYTTNDTVDDLDKIIMGTYQASSGFWLRLRDFHLSAWCDEDWQPYYSTCTVGDNQTLLYQDVNGCPNPTGVPVDNGTVVSCNYCTLSYHTEDTICQANHEVITYPVYDNFETCCNLTNLPADCDLPANVSTACIGAYESSDFDDVVIDTAVEIGRVFVDFAPLIVIISLTVIGLGYLGIKKLKLF